MTDDITITVDREVVQGDELPETFELELTETGETQRYRAIDTDDRRDTDE